MVSFDDFKTEWLQPDNPRRIDYDHTLGYQCVDLIRQYFLECFGLAGGGGVPTAIAYWTSTPADVLQKFTRIADGSVQKGDVLILRTLGHADYAGDGHIMIATGNGDPNSVEGLEQNGSGSGSGLGSDAVRTRFVPRNRLAGVLRPIVVAQPAYTRENIPERHLQLNKNTFKYDCNLTDFETRRTHNLGGYSQGFDFYCTVIYHMADGNSYYSTDAQNSGAFHVSDCQDYVAPPPTPYIPPAPAVKVPLVPYYEVVTTLMYFNSAIDAKRHENALGTINKGQYVEIKTEDNVKCLVRKNTDTDSLWINTSDNFVEAPTVEVQPAINIITLPVDKPPVITEPIDIAPQVITPGPISDIRPVKQPIQWGWINDNHQPSLFQYQGSSDIQVEDLEGSYPAITMTPGTKKVVSRYTMINSQSFLLPDKEFNSGRAYGIDESRQMVEVQKPTILNDITGDIISFWDKFEEAPKKMYQLISDISPAKRHEIVYKSKQFIDGFKSRSKK